MTMSKVGARTTQPRLEMLAAARKTVLPAHVTMIMPVPARAMSLTGTASATTILDATRSTGHMKVAIVDLHPIAAPRSACAVCMHVLRSLLADRMRSAGST